MGSEPKEECSKTSTSAHKAAKHNRITAHYEPAPPKMFREEPFCLIIFRFEHIPKRAHSKSTFHLNTSQKEHIPIFIIFHFEHIPNQAHSKNGTFQKGHIPEQFWSLQPLVQANAGSSKSAKRGAAAAADKSISSYPRSQSSRVPMRSAEGWSQLLFDRCGLHRSTYRATDENQKEEV